MATFGTLQKYQPNIESITVYLKRAAIYFKANDIFQEKQVPVFFSVIWGKVFSLLCDLLSPKKMDEKSLDNMAETMRSHFDPKPLVISDRFYFHTRSQTVAETIAKYVA